MQHVLHVLSGVHLVVLLITQWVVCLYRLFPTQRTIFILCKTDASNKQQVHANMQTEFWFHSHDAWGQKYLFILNCILLLSCIFYLRLMSHTHCLSIDWHLHTAHTKYLLGIICQQMELEFLKKLSVRHTSSHREAVSGGFSYFLWPSMICLFACRGKPQWMWMSHVRRRLCTSKGKHNLFVPYDYMQQCNPQHYSEPTFFLTVWSLCFTPLSRLLFPWFALNVYYTDQLMISKYCKQ